MHILGYNIEGTSVQLLAETAAVAFGLELKCGANKNSTCTSSIHSDSQSNNTCSVYVVLCQKQPQHWTDRESFQKALKSNLL